MSVQTIQEQLAELPLIAAAWYDYLQINNPGLANVMTREDYIREFVRIYFYPGYYAGCSSGPSHTGEL